MFGTGPLHVAAYTGQLDIFVDLSLNGDINPKNTKYQMAAIFFPLSQFEKKRDSLAFPIFEVGQKQKTDVLCLVFGF